MIIGIVVFSLLFVIFVVFGTLLICGKGYMLMSGYRGLTVQEKTEFISKNNLKKIFNFYAYYCFAVAGVTLLALIGACCNSMVVIFISYLLFGAGTIATLIIVNVNSNYKVVPIKRELPVEVNSDESKALLVKNYIEAKEISEGKTEEKENEKETKTQEVNSSEEGVEVKVAPQEETVVINKNTKTGTAKRTIASGSKPKTSATKTSTAKTTGTTKTKNVATTKTATTKPAAKKESKGTASKSTTTKPKTTTKSASANKSKTTK